MGYIKRSRIVEGVRDPLNSVIRISEDFFYRLVVNTQESAVVQSRAVGFPVVLKGLGAKLTHKTERGLVKVNLRSAAEVRRVYREIRQSAGQDWEGCLIQPLVAGSREFVAGMFRDAQFGPVLMFGLGGVFTEAIGDVTFRIAPISRIQADKMMDELKASRLLGDFRGEQAADREQLRQVLMLDKTLLSRD